MLRVLPSFLLVVLSCTIWECQAFVNVQNHPSIISVGKSSQICHVPRDKVAFVKKKSTCIKRTQLALKFPGGESINTLTKSLFAYGGNVPLWQAFGLNGVLFAIFRRKLFNMLTPEGFFHAFALGTGLWTTLGWRGWTLCVAYLFLGSAVTKIRFDEKEKRGIAEGRGGRRGPENVW